MNGMIFAAGLGTRLAPFTDTKPKALVEVNGKPLIEYAIDNFVNGGVTCLVINVHHFADQMKAYITNNSYKWPNTKIKISDESHFLLDTGGGLVNALNLFDDESPIVVGNADIYCNVSVKWLFDEHIKGNHTATLLTRVRNSTRQLLFDNEGRLCGWRNKLTNEERRPRDIEGCHESAFCGYHVIEQGLLRFWLPVRKFSIIDAYLGVAADDNIREVVLPQELYWFDVGTPEKLTAVEDFIRSKNN